MHRQVRVSRLPWRSAITLGFGLLAACGRGKGGPAVDWPQIPSTTLPTFGSTNDGGDGGHAAGSGDGTGSLSDGSADRPRRSPFPGGGPVPQPVPQPVPMPPRTVPSSAPSAEPCDVEFFDLEGTLAARAVARQRTCINVADFTNVGVTLPGGNPAIGRMVLATNDPVLDVLEERLRLEFETPIGSSYQELPARVVVVLPSGLRVGNCTAQGLPSSLTVDGAHGYYFARQLHYLVADACDAEVAGELHGQYQLAPTVSEE